MDSTSSSLELTQRNHAMDAANSDVTADLTQPIDGFSVSAIRSAMENICFEMATSVSRTATTPIINRSNIRCTTIWDAGRRWSNGVPKPSWDLSTPAPDRWDAYHEIGRCREGCLPLAGPLPGVSRSGLVCRTRGGGALRLRGYVADRRGDHAAGIRSGLWRNQQRKPVRLADR